MSTSHDSQLVYPDIRRGGRTVLQAGSLTLPPGSVLGLIGINGAGKSTLLMHMADVLQTPRLHAKAGYAPQQAALPAWLKCEEIARLFGFTLEGLAELFPGLLLEELRGAGGGSMSVGQVQALSVALALATDAPLVLLDEPFAPLDFRRRIALSAILQRPRNDRTIVVSTQSAVELFDVCTRVAVLRDGRLVWEGAVAALVGDDSGRSDEAAVRTLERRLLSLLDGDSSRTDPASGSRTPFACHPL